jgi:RNA polymerase sigma-70 factor (ECF subfamily)
MTSGPLDKLLEKLNEGDPVAAEQVFVTYEPYLRMVVRRQLTQGLQAKFDSIDIVQSVWADVLDRFRESNCTFRDANHLRAFLVKVTRNRFIDRLRQHRRALQSELPLTPTDIEAFPAADATRPSETMQVDELWLQILDVCPPAHYRVLQMKRQGLSLAEIAARSGLHEGRVRRILYDVARRLAEKQQAADSSSSN